MQRRLVDQHGVRQLAVLTERLAVIGEHGHDGVLLVARGPEPGEETAELRVRKRDLAVVQPAGEFGAIRLGGIVGGVGIVEMHPREEGPWPRPREPAERIVDDLIRGAFRAFGKLEMDGDRQIAVTAYCVESFFDRYLKGESISTSAFSSSLYPEVQALE